MACWWHTVRASDSYYRDKEERDLLLVCTTPVFSGIVIWGYGTVNDGICGVIKDDFGLTQWDNKSSDIPTEQGSKLAEKVPIRCAPGCDFSCPNDEMNHK